MAKIGLIGFGGLGKAVYKAALERGHEVMVIDPRAEEAVCKNIAEADLAGVDVVIDVSLGEAVLANAEVCAAAGVNLVIGATGWYDQMDEVKKIMSGLGCLWSANFSIGVNMYLRIVEEAAKLVDKFDEYDVWGHEIHHNNKADSPSGTAKVIGKVLLDNIERKKTMVDEKLDRKIEADELHFSSVRAGAVNFAHTIGFDSAADKITITHEARCRDGYGIGAVKAAEWLVGKKGWFGMKDFLNF
jgi:4-hydroxy-tetrahydrodipicolinate reductase